MTNANTAEKSVDRLTSKLWEVSDLVASLTEAESKKAAWEVQNGNRDPSPRRLHHLRER